LRAVWLVYKKSAWQVTWGLRMNEDELELDALEDSDAVEGADEAEDEELVATDDAEDEVDEDVEEVEPGSKSKTKVKVVVEEELPSIEAKQKDRDALAKAMEEFLARGGKVQEIDNNVVADPPKKPENKYGSRPI
jgi:hypothetical protein